jgi:hypothetical protein
MSIIYIRKRPFSLVISFNPTNLNFYINLTLTINFNINLVLSIFHKSKLSFQNQFSKKNKILRILKSNSLKPTIKSISLKILFNHIKLFFLLFEGQIDSFFLLLNFLFVQIKWTIMKPYYALVFYLFIVELNVHLLFEYILN